MSRAQSMVRRGFILVIATLVPLTVSAQQDENPPSGLTLEALEHRFEEMVNLFLTASDPNEPLQGFTKLIEDLDAYKATEGEVEKVERLLAEGLSYLSQLNFNLNRLDEVDDDMRWLLRVNPDYDYDSTQTSPRLIERFADRKRFLVGFLRLEIEPVDAEVRIGGRLFDPSAGPLAVALEWEPGKRVITVERPGYRSLEEGLNPAAGTITTHRLVMERISPSMRIEATPTGASVTIDGGAVGQFQGTTPLWIGLKPGEYGIEISMDGFRTKRSRWSLSDFLDYSIRERLERTAAVVILQPFSGNDEIQVDGAQAALERVAEDRVQLDLSPGEHRIFVRGDGGVFEETVSLKDQERREIMVKKRPGVALIGILGGDRVAADQLWENLQSMREKLDDWAFLDRSQAGLELVDGLGIDAPVLRSAAESGRILSGVDWRELQTRASIMVPANVLILAVLSDDLMASEADLWFLPSPPGPPSPDYRRIRLTDPSSLAAVISDFDRPLELERTWFGALFLDSDAAEGPVVAAVDPGSGAAVGGVKIGDELISVSGNPVRRAAEAHALLGDAPKDTALDLEIKRSGVRQRLKVKLGTSPAVIPRNAPDLIYAAVAAELSAENAGSTIPQWLKQLNLGVVFLNGGALEEALREFRTARGFPEGQGLGQAAADYWLGVALQSIGPDYYAEASAMFQRAASVPGGRLYHNDGPLIAPRARARLAELGPSN